MASGIERMRVFFPRGRRLRAVALGLLLPIFPRAQGTVQQVVGTGDLPPAAPYAYRLSVMNNNGVDIRQGLFGQQVIYRGKWLGPVLRDHQITEGRDVAFFLAEESGARGALFLIEAPTNALRRIVQIGDRTPEGEVFTRLLEFSSNDSRQILFVAETSGPPPEPGIARSALFLVEEGTITTLLRAGDMTPLGPILRFSTPRLTPDGRVYFTAHVRTAQGAIAQAIFRRTAQGLDPLVRAGDPNDVGGIIRAPLLQAVSPTGDAIAFLDQDDKALYLKRSSLAVRVVKIGDPAPGTSGASFVEILPPVDTIFPALPFLLSPNSLAPGGEVVFVGAFQRPNQNPTLALYRTGGSGLQEVVRTGQNIGGFTVQFLTAPTFGAQGVIYCGMASQAILGGGILRIAGTQRQAVAFPGASATEENLPPYAITRSGHAVYDHIEIALNSNFGMPTGPFDKPAFGLNISLRLHVGSSSPITLLGPVEMALSDSPFLSFSNLVADTAGNLLFIGNVSGGRHLFLCRGGTLEVVAHQGQSVAGLTIRSVTEATMNETGTIALQVEIEDGSALLVRRGGSFQKVIASGDTLFGQFVVDIFDMDMDQSGRIIFVANLAGTGTGSSVNHALLLAVPTGTGYQITSIAGLTALPRVRNTEPVFIADVKLADNGMIALLVRARRDEAIVRIVPSGATYAFQKIAESDGSAPGTGGGKFRRGSDLRIGSFAPEVFSSLHITAQGEVSFLGAVSLPQGGVIRGLFSFAGGSLTKVVADGDVASDGTTLQLLPTLPPPFLQAHTIAPTGDVFFLGVESGVIHLYRRRPGSVQRLIPAVGPQGEEIVPSLSLFATGGQLFFVGVAVGGPSFQAIYRLTF